MVRTIFVLKTWINLLLEIILPSKCILCHIRGEVLCFNCTNSLPLTERATENNIKAIYDYQDVLVKNIIWKLKYHRSSYVGLKLGEMLYQSLLEDIMDIKIFSLGSPIYVIPVPITKSKERKRGYNQSRIIAQGFCNMAENNIFELKNNIIFKKINTIPQAKISNRRKRLKNIKGSFKIKNPESVKNKTIIIIDDVTTTGGTILEIMRLLKKIGAKKVVGFVIAH